MKHKQLFFAAAWASYETAKPGTFHLIPPEDRMPNLRNDYGQMRAMIFGVYPPWDEIVGGLRALENQINDHHLARTEKTK